MEDHPRALEPRTYAAVLREPCKWVNKIPFAYASFAFMEKQVADLSMRRRLFSHLSTVPQSTAIHARVNWGGEELNS